MKKAMMMLLLTGISCALFAQDPQTRNKDSTMNNTDSMMNNNTNTNMNDANNPNTMNDTSIRNNSNYNAYGTVNVPPNVQRSFGREYPAVSNATWQQSGEWYRASYKTGMRNTYVYYSMNGSSFTISLPVLQSYVPDEILTRVINQYGDNLYAVNRIKIANGDDAYQVTLLENGQIRNEWMKEDGSTVMNVDVYRTEQDTMNMQNNMNNDMNTNRPTTMPQTMDTAMNRMNATDTLNNTTNTIDTLNINNNNTDTLNNRDTLNITADTLNNRDTLNTAIDTLNNNRDTLNLNTTDTLNNRDTLNNGTDNRTNMNTTENGNTTPGSLNNATGTGSNNTTNNTTGSGTTGTTPAGTGTGTNNKSTKTTPQKGNQ